MSKIKKVWKIVGALLHRPYLLNRVLEDEEAWYGYLRSKGYPEKGLPVVEWDTLFPDFSEILETFAFLDGGSLPTDIALLKGLARKFPSCRYFEIGTWRGESVANVADAAGSCTTLNLGKKEMLERGMTEKYADLHGFFSKRNSKIVHLEGDSLHFDFAGLHQKYDLIFIDGDHHFASVKHDTQQVFAHLVHEKSIVVWHDYAYHPEKMRPEVFAALWEGVPADKRGHLYHMAHTMSAVYYPDGLSSHPLDAPVTPRLRFRLQMSAHKVQ